MDSLWKLRPDRCLALRGFDGRGAGAALHDATSESFRVSGVFRDMADFCVLMLYDADNFYEHPRVRHLPDFRFDDLVLQFHVRYEGLMPLDSLKYPTIDWSFLSVVPRQGPPALIRLRAYMDYVEGEYTQASGVWTLDTGAAADGDKVRLWFQNYAFEIAYESGNTTAMLVEQLAGQINSVAYGDESQELEAEWDGLNGLRVRAKRPGIDGNRLRFYTQATGAMTLTGPEKLSGGQSNATWQVTLDFGALGLPEIRQMWMTFAPQLPDGEAYAPTEWSATFTRWTVTGESKWLEVAGNHSVRIEETDRWVTYKGTWSSESGFYSKGFARRAAAVGDSASIRYHCQQQHDLYLGTSLYSDRGRVVVSVDGDEESSLDCYLATEPPINTRRLLRTALPPGEHSVVITLEGKAEASLGQFFYLDFLEAAVPAELPAALPGDTRRMPANDYGTDHTYKLSPARMMWMLDQLGFAGAMNVYVSIFWWNNRKRVDAVLPQMQIEFSGTFRGFENDGTQNLNADGIFLNVGGLVIGKTVTPEDTNASIAKHFANFINSVFVGLYASHNGGILTLTTHAAERAYEIELSYSTETDPKRAGSWVSTGVITATGSLTGSIAGRWLIDTSQEATLNRGAREWLADLCRECQARDRELTLAYSMELVNPPDDDAAAGEYWASRFPNGQPVLTASAFGNLASTHCAFNRVVLDYQKRVFRETADLMAEAGLPVVLQVGEFLWWFFTNYPQPPLFGTTPITGLDEFGMAFYDPETMADFQAIHGRPLFKFDHPDIDPATAPVDAAFLADRLDAYIRELRAHVRETHPAAEIEILLPLDVNYSRQYGRYNLGGRLNHFVNIPASFRDPALAPFDRIKMEALDFGSGTRSTTLAKEALRFPFDQGTWPKAKVKYLIPWFNGGCPWTRETLAAIAADIPTLNYWAFDHLCMFGWPVETPLDKQGSQVV